MATQEPEGQLRLYAEALAAGIEEAIPRWVTRSVERVVTAWEGSVPEAVRRDSAAAAARAQAEVGPAVWDLLLRDVDDQPTTPLSLLRSAVVYPTGVLRHAGVPAVERDEFARRAFPHDVYDLSPATLADVDESLAGPGLEWGAAKAFVHRRRHRQ